MSEQTSGAVKGLPENAYKELKPGEEYTPLMPASTTPQEITTGRGTVKLKAMRLEGLMLR